MKFSSEQTAQLFLCCRKSTAEILATIDQIIQKRVGIPSESRLSIVSNCQEPVRKLTIIHQLFRTTEGTRKALEIMDVVGVPKSVDIDGNSILHTMVLYCREVKMDIITALGPEIPINNIGVSPFAIAAISNKFEVYKQLFDLYKNYLLSPNKGTPTEFEACKKLLGQLEKCHNAAIIMAYLSGNLDFAVKAIALKENDYSPRLENEDRKRAYIISKFIENLHPFVATYLIDNKITVVDDFDHTALAMSVIQRDRPNFDSIMDSIEPILAYYKYRRDYDSLINVRAALLDKMSKQRNTVGHWAAMSFAAASNNTVVCAEYMLRRLVNAGVNPLIINHVNTNMFIAFFAFVLCARNEKFRNITEFFGLRVNDAVDALFRDGDPRKAFSCLTGDDVYIKFSSNLLALWAKDMQNSGDPGINMHTHMHYLRMTYHEYIDELFDLYPFLKDTMAKAQLEESFNRAINPPNVNLILTKIVTTRYNRVNASNEAHTTYKRALGLTQHGETILMRAAAKGCLYVVKLCLEKGKGGKLNKKNRFSGDTALHKAAGSTSPEAEAVVRYLLTKNPSKTLNRNKQTAAHVAAAVNVNVYKMLSDYGFNSDSKAVLGVTPRQLVDQRFKSFSQTHVMVLEQMRQPHEMTDVNHHGSSSSSPESNSSLMTSPGSCSSDEDNSESPDRRPRRTKLDALYPPVFRRPVSPDAAKNQEKGAYEQALDGNAPICG